MNIKNWQNLQKNQEVWLLLEIGVWGNCGLVFPRGYSDVEPRLPSLNVTALSVSTSVPTSRSVLRQAYHHRCPVVFLIVEP